MISPSQLYDTAILAQALRSLGDYVYGYYHPRKAEPFYVGKGKASRVLSHWNEACRDNEQHRQYQVIRSILGEGEVPVAKILAYDLQSTKPEEIYGVVERVLQNTFGIEHHLNENIYKARVKTTATLVQNRDDSRNHPVLSLEAAYCKYMSGRAVVSSLQKLSDQCEAPLLLVGLSKSYHPNYSQYDLREMARMYWVLDKLKNFSALRESNSSVLVGWVSKFGGPQIVGVWRIKPGSFRRSETSKRYSCEVEDDFALRRSLLGNRLEGEGQSYQGPRICLPA